MTRVCEYGPCQAVFSISCSTQRFCSSKCRILAKTRRLAKAQIIRWKRWAVRNPERLRELTKKYRDNSRFDRSVYNRQYTLDHWDVIKERLRAERATRRSKTKQSPISSQEWECLVESWGGCCAYCGIESEYLTRDHVVPLIHGGVHTLDNLVPACLECNTTKGSQNVSDFLVTNYLKRKLDYVRTLKG